MGFRPGDGTVPEVNPPRFSWRYEPEMVLPEATKPTNRLRHFRLQVASSPDFSSPSVDVQTALNFHNELAPLEPGVWFWRVGYGLAGDADVATWSDTRSFEVQPEAPLWDRSGFGQAAEAIKALPRPRLGPPEGDWTGFAAATREDELRATLFTREQEAAERAVASDWWSGLPSSDAPPADAKLARRDVLRFHEIARGIAAAAFVWRVTGDERYAAVKDRLVDFSKYPPGGLSAPEYNGTNVKFTTEIVKFLALAYDWTHEALAPQERAAVLEAINWRLDDVFFRGRSWAAGDLVDPLGLGVKGGSHPYQNAMWASVAVLVAAGESAAADRALPLVLNYLAGVGASQGPHEAYNEGHGYGTEKGGTLLEAMLVAHLLAPQLQLGRSPQLRGLGDWYAQVFPLGVQRLPWGDEWVRMLRLKQEQMMRAWQLAWLTGEPRYAARAREFQRWRFRGDWKPQFEQTWLALLAFSRLELPEPDLTREPKAKLFAKAGWMFAGSAQPSEASMADASIQLQMQARPMGKSTHSYRSDGSFVWNAFGETLSAGGDNLKYSNPYAVSTVAHNGLLINGDGQEYRYDQFYEDASQPPVMARPLAWEEGDGYVYWAADVTPAYFADPRIKRVIRHAVMVDGRWFAIYDDLHVAPTAGMRDKASFLFKVAPPVAVEIAAPEGRFRYKLGDVSALVAFGNDPASLSMVNQAGREGYLNPITGKDWGPEVNEGMIHLATTSQRGAIDPNADHLKDIPVWNNLWVTRDFDDNGRAHFLAGLIAWKGEAGEPEVERLSDKGLKVKWPDGTTQSVSFAPGVEAGIVIDPEIAATSWRP